MTYRYFTAIVVLLCFTVAERTVVADENTQQVNKRLAPENFSPVVLPSQIMQTLLQPAPLNEQPGAGRVGVRDPAAVKVYEKIAPAVVLITDGRTGYGTGVFIRPDGWLLTNHHVANFMPYAKNGALSARVVYGEIGKDGAMEPVEGFVTASVYRLGHFHPDLALLKLNNLPAGKKSVPYVELADRSPPPGTDCVAIGNPGRGFMWTLRTGTVAAIGRFPRDQLSAARLFHGGDRDVIARAERLIAGQPSTKILLSTCPVNPGDSGGPLVDKEGRLIALTFAGPVNENGVVFDKFTYHVHLDEIKSFLNDWPQKPLVEPPPMLPSANRQGAIDLDDDGTPDTWAFALKDGKDQLVTGMLIDVDQDSPLAKMKGALKSQINRLVGANPLSDWEYECAVTFVPRPAYFFDRDNDGRIDLAIIEERTGPVRLVRKGSAWKAESHSGPLIPDDPFDDETLNKKFKKSFLPHIEQARKDFQKKLDAADKK